MSGLSLALEDHGGRFSLGVGDTFSLRLPETPTTGFCWELESSDPERLQPLGSDFLLSTPPSFGSGGTRILSFRALAPGVVALALRYWQPWEGLASVSQRWGVTLEIGEGSGAPP
jgi:inhibitor of cysteine peptidase